MLETGLHFIDCAFSCSESIDQCMNICLSLWPAFKKMYVQKGVTMARSLALVWEAIVEEPCHW